ncbi:MAG: metal-dependent transcriptional regulator [Anaerolineales bacterium]|nr:metal-dependent transcriptional regulator [Anaerolineales bacterium]
MGRLISDTVEDYLKMIFDLSAETDRVSTGMIADALNVSPASVTDMIQRLATEDPPLLDYIKHQGVALTDEGIKIALEIIRHHRLIELFLHEVLGYSWDQVHAEADRLEHVISEDFEERVAAVLGDPLRGLHGKPIPTASLEMPDQNTSYLLDMRPEQHGVIHSVNDDDPDFLRYLEAQGLVPGAKFSIVDFSPYDNNLRLRLSGQDQEIVLGMGVTTQVQVEVLDFES